MTISHPITTTDVRAIYDSELARLTSLHATTPQDHPLPFLAWRGTRSLVHMQIHQVHALPPQLPAELHAARDAAAAHIVATQLHERGVLLGEDGTRATAAAEVERLRMEREMAPGSADLDIEHQHEAIEKPHNKAIWREVDRLVLEAGITAEGQV